ncbi:MAG: hypothetical protein IKD46_01980 [Lentisphaeria bacterium]|nr:hypothetical protein [Lentisphaeria bacterium]
MIIKNHQESCGGTRCRPERHGGVMTFRDHDGPGLNGLQKSLNGMYIRVGISIRSAGMPGRRVHEEVTALCRWHIHGGNGSSLREGRRISCCARL